VERDPEKKIRLGLFGGTFDPIHYGHINTAEEIHNKFKLTKTIFIPSHIPPHKKTPETGPAHRLEMVRQAVSGYDLFEVSDAEIKRDSSSYSFQTIKYFKELHKEKSELFFIMGLDTFLEIHTWKNYPCFFSECHFIIMNRPDCSNKSPEDILPADAAAEFVYNYESSSFRHTSGYSVHYVEVTPHDISSTDIRKKIKNGRKITGLIPEKVADYIKDHRLYR